MKYEFHNRTHDYVVDHKKIKYLDKDKLSDKLHFGFETIFTYCLEFQKGNVSS